MCANIPVKIVRLLEGDGALAKNRFGKESVISLKFLKCASLDDHVIVGSGGYALQKLTKEEAETAISAANSLAVMIQMDLSCMASAY